MKRVEWFLFQMVLRFWACLWRERKNDDGRRIDNECFEEFLGKSRTRLEIGLLVGNFGVYVLFGRTITFTLLRTLHGKEMSGSHCKKVEKFFLNNIRLKSLKIVI